MIDLFRPVPIPWSEFPAECLWYFAPMSVLHLLIFGIGSCVLFLLSRRSPDTLRRRVRRFGLFLLLFLLVGSFFNGLWSCLVWDILYHSTDYIFDFMPFWPITQSVIDAPWGDDHGRLLDVSLFQLQLVWFAFAVSTWKSTFILFRLVSTRLSPDNHALLDTQQERPVCNRCVSSLLPDSTAAEDGCAGSLSLGP